MCTGTVDEPTAPEGNLCVYGNLEANVSKNAALNEAVFNWQWGVIIDTEGGEGGAKAVANTAMPFGFDITALGENFEHAGINGSYAVTG